MPSTTIKRRAVRHAPAITVVVQVSAAKSTTASALMNTARMFVVSPAVDEAGYRAYNFRSSLRVTKVLRPSGGMVRVSAAAGDKLTRDSAVRR